MINKILFTALLVIGMTTIASADSFVAPIFNADTNTATFEGHTYARVRTAEFPGERGLSMFVAIYKSEENGDLMSISKCEDCLPFSWYVVHDTTDLYSDINYQIFDTNCDGTFDTRDVGKEAKIPRLLSDCLHIEGGIYGLRQAI
jgi:hypothetical protein